MDDSAVLGKKAKTLVISMDKEDSCGQKRNCDGNSIKESQNLATHFLVFETLHDLPECHIKFYQKE